MTWTLIILIVYRLLHLSLCATISFRITKDHRNDIFHLTLSDFNTLIDPCFTATKKNMHLLMDDTNVSVYSKTLYFEPTLEVFVNDLIQYICHYKTSEHGHLLTIIVDAGNIRIAQGTQTVCVPFSGHT